MKRATVTSRDSCRARGWAARQRRRRVARCRSAQVMIGLERLAAFTATCLTFPQYSDRDQEVRLRRLIRSPRRAHRRTGRARRRRAAAADRLGRDVRQRPPGRDGDRHGQGDVPHRAGQGPAGGELLRHRVGPLVLALRQRPAAAGTAARTPAPSARRRGTSSASSCRRTSISRAARLLPRPLAQGPPPQAAADPAEVHAASSSASSCPGGRLQVVTDHQGYFEENIEPVVARRRG